MTAMLSTNVMRRAFQQKDATFDGTFFVAVKTTGVFCRPVCRAKPPRPENVEFFATANEALRQGYRPCKLCRPLEPLGHPPPLVRTLLDLARRSAPDRVTDRDLASAGIDPGTARRQFQSFYQMTFAEYQRSARLGSALKRLNEGTTMIAAQTEAGFDSSSGFRDALARTFGTPALAVGTAQVLTAAWFPSPLGTLLAVAFRSGVAMLEFVDGRGIEQEIGRLRAHFGTAGRSAVIVPGDHSHLSQLRTQLEEYFAGSRRSFSIALAPRGTDFQLRAWQYLRTIPYAQTRSYRQQAAAIGSPEAVRAVGGANGRNPLAIIVPCHRVIGSNGTLTGYGGGTARKQWLLNHEQAIAGAKSRVQ